MEKKTIIKYLLRYTNHGDFVNAEGGWAFAPSNVALCKYWGKRDPELNLPVTSSLSISLGNRGAFTHIRQQGNEDQYQLNGNSIGADTKFAQRLKKYLDLFRPNSSAFYQVEINSSVPIAAGMASSACGFASIIMALNNLYDWRLSKTDLSILARLGSGSACRSLWDGFVEWKAGEDSNGYDSYAVPIDVLWPEIRIAALLISTGEKSISSTEAMQRTVATSPLYKKWPQTVATDLANIKYAITQKDFNLLGKSAEQNAITMHALMLAAHPPIKYSQAATIEAMKTVWLLRKNGTQVYFTQDAGPNLQLLFLAENEANILPFFSKAELIVPFRSITEEQLVIVDEHDVEQGTGGKLSIHLQGQLHRAFSIFILRKRHGKMEILLQQRSSNKYHSPNLWTNTCCGHPRVGENIVAAAMRRLKEEMGFAVSLSEVGTFRYFAKFSEINLTEHEYDHVLVGYLDRNEFDVNHDEVQNFRWIEMAELEADLNANSPKYTVWLKPALEILKKTL